MSFLLARRPRLVKNTDKRYKRVPLYVDSGNTIWQTTHGMTRNLYPGLLSLFQQSGSRVLTPTGPYTTKPFVQTFKQLQGQKDGWDLLMSTLLQNGSASFAYGINGQTNYYELLFNLLRAAHQAILYGGSANNSSIQQNVDLALQQVENLSHVVGANSGGATGNSGLLGYGTDIFEDLYELGSNLAKVLADLDPVRTFDLFESLARIFGSDDWTVQQLFYSLGVNGQKQLKAEAGRRWLNDGSILGSFIYLV